MRFVSTCAVCAAPVGAEGRVQCGECQTLYCGVVCQGEDVQHGQACQLIAGAGGADQFYVNKKYDAAAAEAMEACAEELAKRTCFICKEDEAEGLVRDCACRGDAAGIAHLSCLVRLAQHAHDENHHQCADGNSKWGKCDMCSHLFGGKVALALAWACLKTYLPKPSPTCMPCLTKWNLAVVGSLCVVARTLISNGRNEEALPIGVLYLEEIRKVPDEV